MTEQTLKSFFVNNAKLDGTKYTIAATPKEIIVACGDCSQPGVYFFDDSLTLFEGGSLAIANPSKTALHLAVEFSDKLRQTRVVVGSEARVDIVVR